MSQQTIQEVIELIIEKPGMYIGSPNMRDLWMFLNGFAFARIGVEKDYAYLHDFNSFVHERFKVNSTQGVIKIIEFQSMTEQGAWKLFCELFNEFKASRSTK